MLHSIKKIIPQSLKNLYHLIQAVTASIINGFPARRLVIVGVTGTDGKTTTVQMVGAILREAGIKTAVASTINFRIGDKEWVNATKFTTMSSFAVQKFLRRAVAQGCTHAVLEVSSHSLDQNRVWGISPKVSVVTNVTREHLDYHKTIEQYREAKKKLFLVSENIVVNADMENPGQFLDVPAHRKLAFSTDSWKLDGINQDITRILAENIEITSKVSQFRVNGIFFQLPLLGHFNIENALGAIGVSILLGIDLTVASRALAGLKSVPGRIEFVPNDKGYHIMIDYALTPEALKKLYELVQDINKDKKKVIAVFGACGDRDKGKRPIMGGVVNRFASIIILTNEDPYYENASNIIEEIAVGVSNRIIEDNFFKILDRRKAIQKALSLAQEGDYVVITGKGAEEMMAVGSHRIPWSDKRVIMELLEERKV